MKSQLQGGLETTMGATRGLGTTRGLGDLTGEKETAMGEKGDPERS